MALAATDARPRTVSAFDTSEARGKYVKPSGPPDLHNGADKRPRRHDSSCTQILGMASKFEQISECGLRQIIAPKRGNHDE